LFNILEKSIIQEGKISLNNDNNPFVKASKEKDKSDIEAESEEEMDLESSSFIKNKNNNITGKNVKLEEYIMKI